MGKNVPLHAARMASGPPVGLGVLAGEPAPGRKRATSFAWTVPGFSQEMWLQRLYGDLGEMVLSQRLPEPVRACIVEYSWPKVAVPPRVVVSCTGMQAVQRKNPP
ncbi:STY0301 family protein [Pseudoduganella buxea]|uniref:STY0301 family protein n=1 Tax=Pseudoduganella buxea TaxID=1949069 RepID=UPI003530F247